MNQRTRARRDTGGPLSTGAVARELGVTEARIQTVLRGRPELKPPVVARKCLWEGEHVAALRVRLCELGDLPASIA